MVIGSGFYLVGKSKAPWWVKIILWFVDRDYWITIRDTIYCPDEYDNLATLTEYADSIAHERRHSAQWKQYGIIGFPLLYFLVPFPIFFAYFRWRFERRPYLDHILSGNLTIDQVVSILWKKYWWTWPPRWMWRWFQDHSKKPF